MKRIFVSVASYRDADLPNTIIDALNTATHPQRITFGVLNQLAPEDTDCFAPKIEQVREIVVSHKETRGVCWARSRIFDELLHDEDIILQIDSHSRFDRDWDTKIEYHLNAVNDPKAVLSHYPINFDPTTGEKSERLYVRFRVTHFDDFGIPHIGNSTLVLDEAPKDYRPTALIAGGCFFTYADTVRHVKYDPYICYVGEEVSYAARLWTSGYNIYLPPQPFMYHEYLNRRLRKRPSFFNDNSEAAGVLEAQGKDRVSHLLDVRPSTDPVAIHDIGRYPLGTDRSLGDWMKRFGILPKYKIATVNAMEGIFD